MNNPIPNSLLKQTLRTLIPKIHVFLLQQFLLLKNLQLVFCTLHENNFVWKIIFFLIFLLHLLYKRSLSFQNYVDKRHPNIKFTSKVEQNKYIFILRYMNFS